MSGNPPTFDVSVNGSTFTFYKQDDFFKTNFNTANILADNIGYIATHATSPIKVIDRSVIPPCIKTETSTQNIINNTPITLYTPQ